MAKKAAETENLPAMGKEGPAPLFPVATQDDLEAYSFLDANALDIIRENLGGQTLTQSDLEKIKFPSSGTTFWQVPSLSGKMVPVEALTGIVLMQKQARAYWPNDYDGSSVPPDCSSKDLAIGVGNPGGTCATCPFSQWGSVPQVGNKVGSNAQACKQVGILFLLQPGENLPTVIPVPPTSLQPIKKFMLKLASKNISYKHCVVSLSLEETKNKKGTAYSQIAPSVVAMLPDEAAAQIDKYVVSLRGTFESVQVNQDDVE